MVIEMDCRQRLESYLREQGIEFEVTEHRTAFTAQRVAASEHVSGRAFAKVVMARSDGDLLMLVVPASRMVDLAKVGNVVSKRDVRMAYEYEFAPAFPDCEPGAMPPFGNLYDVPVYADTAMGSREHMVFQAGTHSLTMSVPYADFERVVQPRVADITVGT
ncbi:MAG: aminoacyl-tRNA deacylase [Actinomycetota bacterium]